MRPYASLPQIWETQPLVIPPPPLNMPQPPSTYESTMQVSTGGVGGDADNLTEEEISDDEEQQFNNNSGEDEDEEEDDDVFIFETAEAAAA